MTKRRTEPPPLDGEALFEAAMRDIKPRRRQAARPAAPATPPADPPAKRPPVPSRRQAGPKPPAAADLADGAESPPAAFGGLDRRTAERLRRGRLEVEARLDLHGRGQAEAHAALTGFIHASYRHGRRCVLVITGKGSPRAGATDGIMPNRQLGILRRNVPRWLAGAELRSMVLGVTPARPQHGGDGALYVLLRRKR